MKIAWIFACSGKRKGLPSLPQAVDIRNKTRDTDLPLPKRLVAASFKITLVYQLNFFRLVPIGECKFFPRQMDSSVLVLDIPNSKDNAAFLICAFLRNKKLVCGDTNNLTDSTFTQDNMLMELLCICVRLMECLIARD